jgi:hypothetical protein
VGGESAIQASTRSVDSNHSVLEPEVDAQCDGEVTFVAEHFLQPRLKSGYEVVTYGDEVIEHAS